MQRSRANTANHVYDGSWYHIDRVTRDRPGGHSKRRNWWWSKHDRKKARRQQKRIMQECLADHQHDQYLDLVEWNRWEYESEEFDQWYECYRDDPWYGYEWEDDPGDPGYYDSWDDYTNAGDYR